MEGTSQDPTKSQRKRKKNNRGQKRNNEPPRYAGSQSRSTGTEVDLDSPSDECKAVITRSIYDFYKETSLTRLNIGYLMHGPENGKKAFLADMKERFMRALEDDKWAEDRRKSGFDRWMEHRLDDALWNPAQLLEKYSRLDGTKDTVEYTEYKARLASWKEALATWHASRTNKRCYWDNNGDENMYHLRGEHLVFLKHGVKVDYVGDGRRGAFGVVRKCFVSGDERIPGHWALASKRPHENTSAIKVREFEAEALAIRFPHRGCVKWLAVHNERSEGFTLWWNGGTLRQMLNSDTRYATNVNDTIQAAMMTHTFKDDMIIESQRVEVFRAKRTDLAWTFIHIMYHVHQAHNLHNDLSPDNILLHFPPNCPGKVYIGVCDWGLSGSIYNPKVTFYMYESARARDEDRKQRWWLAPEIAYVVPPPSNEQQFHIKPNMDMKSETYAVGKIARRIFGGHISDGFYERQIEDPDFEGGHTYDRVMMASAFEASLDQLANEDPTRRASITRVVNRFMLPPFNWPIPEDTLRPYADGGPF